MFHISGARFWHLQNFGGPLQFSSQLVVFPAQLCRPISIQKKLLHPKVADSKWWQIINSFKLFSSAWDPARSGVLGSELQTSFGVRQHKMPLVHSPTRRPMLFPCWVNQLWQEPPGKTNWQASLQMSTGTKESMKATNGNKMMAINWSPKAPSESRCMGEVATGEPQKVKGCSAGRSVLTASRSGSSVCWDLVMGWSHWHMNIYSI